MSFVVVFRLSMSSNKAQFAFSSAQRKTSQRDAKLRYHSTLTIRNGEHWFASVDGSSPVSISFKTCFQCCVSVMYDFLPMRRQSSNGAQEPSGDQMGLSLRWRK